MSHNKNILALNEVGQSIWYDNLSRDVLQSGELKNLIDSGVSGLTSNPTIFQKAISGSATYDTELKVEIKKTNSATEITETLMVADVGAAADMLRSVYDRTKGADGYASIEVSPLLARDTEGTIQEARRLWKRLNKPNIMIKVPATKEGIPVIQQLITEGINVNVTLIFSVAVYEKVVNAYLSGLEARAKNNQDLRVASVASFFVSRVDTICEKGLDDVIAKGNASPSDKSGLLGKIGIANSKLAYERYESLFGGDRFHALKMKGAWIQRPLWASTGTKNPAFSPVLYVEELAGPDTVNTVPPQTLAALMEKSSAKNRLIEDVGGAQAIINTVNKLGIPFDNLLVELEVQGVKLFADSYNALIADVTKKIQALK
jgi:transaldolase